MHGVHSVLDFAKFYFTKDGLAGNSPNFPTTKVSLLTVVGIDIKENGDRILHTTNTP